MPRAKHPTQDETPQDYPAATYENAPETDAFSPADLAVDTNDPDGPIVLRPHVNGIFALTAAEQTEIQAAVRPYQPYPSTPATGDNLEARRVAAEKVVADASHLAAVIASVQVSVAKQAKAQNAAQEEREAKVKEEQDKKNKEQLKAKLEAEDAALKIQDGLLQARKDALTEKQDAL